MSLLVSQNPVARPAVDLVPAGADEALSISTQQRIIESVPDSTRRVYAGDWSRFTAWCATAGRTALPATAATLAEYVDTLAGAGKAPSTIERAQAAIVTAHRTAGHPRPDTTLSRAVLRAYRRERAQNGATIRKATPASVRALRLMLDGLNPATVAGLRDRALLLLGFALAARRSELAALNIEDLNETAEGIEVLIRTSKTDRESAGRTVAVPRGARTGTCPVKAVQAWLALLAGHGRTSGPLFLRVDRWGQLGRAPSGRGTPDGRLTGQAVATVVRRAALAAGLDPDALWSGHSLRRGLATEARRAGHDQIRIGRHGGWVDGSRALAGYVEDADRWADSPLVGLL